MVNCIECEIIYVGHTDLGKYESHLGNFNFYELPRKGEEIHIIGWGLCEVTHVKHCFFKRSGEEVYTEVKPTIYVK